VSRRAAAALVLIAAICVGAGASRPGGAPGVQGARDVFPIMPWELQREKQGLLDEPGHGIDSLRACGFDTVAFVRPDQVASVEAAGMRAIVGRPGDLHVQWRKLSDRAIVDRVQSLVDASGESEALIGYFLADEPGAVEFPALAKAVAAVKRLAPGRLAYVNLYPNHATASQLGTKTYAEYLERYVTVVRPQFISYDNYGVAYSMDLSDRARVARYFSNLLQVRRVALEHGLPFWNVVSSNQIRPHTTVPSPASLLLQAYTTLAAGAHGLTWFSYYAGGYAYAPIDAAGNRTATWSYLRMVNEQVQALAPILRRLRSTGVYFTSPPPANGAPRLPGKLVTSIESPAAVMVGELAGGNGETYALVVNLSLKRSTRVVVQAEAQRIRRVSPVDGSFAPVGRDGSLWLAAGQGTLLELEQ
jgi:hypothetical protein